MCIGSLVLDWPSLLIIWHRKLVHTTVPYYLQLCLSFVPGQILLIPTSEGKNYACEVHESCVRPELLCREDCKSSSYHVQSSDHTGRIRITHNDTLTSLGVERAGVDVFYDLCHYAAYMNTCGNRK